MIEWKIQGSRVYGQGYSYNLNNKVDATKLYETLNHYEEISRLNKNIDKQFDNITRQVIQLKLTINTLREEINHLGDTINEINNTD